MSWGSKLAVAAAIVGGFALSGILLSLDARAEAGGTVGMVTKVENQAQVGGQTAAPGTLVHTNDTLSTGPKAHLKVTFRDNTELTLGENASVVVDRFVFDPDAGVGEATLNATKGAFRLATGRISDMTKKDIKVGTPFGALAVRGTDFWSGSLDGQYGVLLMSASHLDVKGERCDKDNDEDHQGKDEDRRKCRCAITLNKPGYGTDIDWQNKCPGAPYQWPPEKIAAALSSTSFALAAGGSSIIPAAAAAATAGAFVGSTAGNQDQSPPKHKPKPRSP